MGGIGKLERDWRAGGNARGAIGGEEWDGRGRATGLPYPYRARHKRALALCASRHADADNLDHTTPARRAALALPCPVLALPWIELQLLLLDLDEQLSSTSSSCSWLCPVMDAHARGSTPPARPKHSHSSSITSAQAAPSAAMASSSKSLRGSTPTASRSAVKLVDADKSSRPGSRDSLKQKLPKKPDDAPRPTRSDEQLGALRSDFDSLRSHLTCKICDRLLYQPYTISCGHTYCYTCLCTWFVSNKNRKTCPDCRILVKELPAPAYVIREMTAIFIARPELLPPGETIEEHIKWQKDEAEAVQQDKENKDSRTGGLFKGCFKPHPLHPRGPSLQIMRDQEDGVDRCPICTWELEDGGCARCGLLFDETGEVSWGDSFTGFSDMDEMSEHDTEDLDAEMDMDDVDFEGYDEAMDAWGDYLPEQGSFMMRRFLEGGIPPHAAAFARRRPMTHSEAGSRRSYSQSIVSDMYGDEMDTVEEEDEEDSEMNDFIDDGEIATSPSTSAASSTPRTTPRPSAGRARVQGRARRIVESETSSTISSVIEEEEDEDEEDQGPIRRGQRAAGQTRAFHRANGSINSRGHLSSASTDISAEDADEEQQALLQQPGWSMLQRDDDEMENDDENDSDTGTTVGWEPLANSNDRSRMGGSLTPTADRPRPSAPIRPPSRTGNVHVLNASRGLRRRSSVLSASNGHYEDGEADDDDSDQDGDIDMAMNSLRTRRSQAHMRNIGAFSNPVARFANRNSTQNEVANDLDTDENSDASQPGRRRRTPQYDPRISYMFAAHQQALQQHQMAGNLIDVEQRSITPVARPRTRNRNRPSPAQAFSPFAPPTRLRTPLMDSTSNMGTVSRLPMSPPRRNPASPTQPSTGGVGNFSRFDRAPSVGSMSSSSTVLTPSTSASSSQNSIDTIAQSQAAAAVDMIDRPQSRVSARPSSATGRRSAAGFAPGFSPVNPPFPHTNMGLHVQGSVLPPFQAHGNPWAAFVQSRVRSRNSRQVLREQSSTATMRPVSSRANIREAGNPSQGVRSQASRINLRPQQSRRQLNSQASTRTLRASEHARPPPSPSQTLQTTSQPAARPVRLTPDERDTRARELIETRRRALGQSANVAARTNPFAPGFQRPANPAFGTSSAQSTISQHVRSNSNESMQSTNSTGTTQGAPTSPTLGRRRSNRNINAAPSGDLLAPSLSAYTSPVTNYANDYYRPRQGSLSNTSATYELPMTTSTTNMNPMMAGPLI